MRLHVMLQPAHATLGINVRLHGTATLRNGRKLVPQYDLPTTCHGMPCCLRQRQMWIVTAAAAASPETSNCKCNTSTWEWKQLGTSHLCEAMQHAGELEPVSASTCDKQKAKSKRRRQKRGGGCRSRDGACRVLTDRS
jgi:hypothetical protein